MFSENGKISERQLYRMIVVAMLGPSLLICPRLLGGFGSVGLAAYLLAGLMSALYIWGVFELKSMPLNSFTKDVLKGFFGVIASVRLLAVAFGGLYIMYDVVRRILLPKTNSIMILLLVGVLLVYWIGSGLESTARAMELLFYWVLVPIVISLVVAIPNVEMGNLIDGSKSGVANSGVLGFVINTFAIWIIFTPVDLLWLCKEKFDVKKVEKPVWKGFAFFWAANVITYIIILGIYGVRGLNVGKNYPLIKVMQISGVPGDFLRRVDGFMGAFLVVSIFCGIALALVILKMVVASILKEMDVTGKNVRDKGRGQITRLVSLGVVVIISLGVLLLNKNWDYEENQVFAGIELEQRNFVMSIILFKDGIVFEIANEEENNWQSSSEYVRLKTRNLKEAERLYKENGEKELDFSQMKILFVEGDINLDSNKRLKGAKKWDGNYRENLEYMYTKERFGENILVCELDGDLKKMTANAINDEKALAVVVENILKTSGKDKGRELYKVRNELVE